MNDLFVQSVMSSNGKMVLISITSIALIADISPNGTRVTLKEKDQNGSQIMFDLNEMYGTFTGRILAATNK